MRCEDGAVDFVDAVWGEASFLKLAIHVAGAYEDAVFFRGADLAQDGVAGVRHGVAVEQDAVAVEAPCGPGLPLE